jgi:hypothetical protein
MSAFQPNKCQPIWRYTQKDITILSSMGSTSAARGRSSCTFSPMLDSSLHVHSSSNHPFPHAGQQPAGAQQLLTFSSQLDSSFSSSPRHLQHLPSGQQYQDTRTAASPHLHATCSTSHLDSNIKTWGQQLLLISTPPGTKPAGQQHFHSKQLQQVDSTLPQMLDSNITWEHACLLPFPNRQNEDKKGGTTTEKTLKKKCRLVRSF